MKKRYREIVICAAVLIGAWLTSVPICAMTARATDRSEWDQRERLVKAEQEQARALKSIAASLKVIERKCR